MVGQTTNTIDLVSVEVGSDELTLNKSDMPGHIMPALSAECRSWPVIVRNEPWIVLSNRLNGQYIRVSENVWTAVSQLRGNVSLQHWLENHKREFSPETLLEPLYALQRLSLIDGLPHQKMGRPRRNSINPLMIRIPLFNPTVLLNYVVAATRWIGCKASLFCIAGLVGLAILLGISDLHAVKLHWSRQLDIQWWWQYLLLYPLMRCLHELSHAVVLRRYGKPVPEAGISLLVLMPLPYIDATHVWSLAQRRSRILVTAAGMLADLAMSSLGMIAWFILQPGLLADLAFSLMMLGSVSLLLFNANPLLKFDGYYLLEDVLDSPGLSRRALEYYRFLFKRYLLRLNNAVLPVCHQGERVLFLIYGFASTLYRVFISFIITIFLVNEFKLSGVLLSAFAFVPLLIRPLVGFTKYLLLSNELKPGRKQILLAFATFLMAVASIIGLVPLPASTRTEGIVWVPRQAQVYVSTSGILSDILVKDGDQVKAGQALFALRSDKLEIQIERKRAELAGAQIDAYGYLVREPALHATLLHQSSQLEKELQELLAKKDELIVRAQIAGRIAFESAVVIPGSFIEKGMLLSYVVDARSLVVRAVVSQPSVGRIVHGVQDVTVRLSEKIAASLKAEVISQVPAGNHDLPSASLANKGFGGFPADQVDGNVKTHQEVFHLELGVLDTIPELQLRAAIGSRAYVTLRHQPETLAVRWWRGSRQLLIRHLKV